MRCLDFSNPSPNHPTGCPIACVPQGYSRIFKFFGEKALQLRIDGVSAQLAQRPRTNSLKAAAAATAPSPVAAPASGPLPPKPATLSVPSSTPASPAAPPADTSRASAAPTPRAVDPVLQVTKAVETPTIKVRRKPRGPDSARSGRSRQTSETKV